MPLNQSFTIDENAIFVADAHFNTNRQELKTFLLKLKNKEIKTKQLFLMGDIFDFLSPQIKYFVQQNQNIISLLNELSKNIDIIYLEGNHDFNLSSLFFNIIIYKREQQPVIYNYKNKKVAISHGDIFTPIQYNIFTKFIRNKITLKLLNLIDINYWLSKKINSWFQKKRICNGCDNFEKFANNRISLYPKNIDLIIEGHFHYGNETKKYINVPSLACQNRYYILSY
jgi:UDP-2,3-diacylglucosamine hydrolase